MRLIESKVELLEQESGLQGIYKQIELAGRTCYKSEDKITDASSVDFVKRMQISNHTAMLEHGTVYLRCKNTEWPQIPAVIFSRNPYSKVYHHNDEVFVTTNYRVIVENGLLDCVRFICEPTEFHERRITLRFQANIHFYKDATRHRKHSFAIESTRWINYMREKFGMSISFLKPTWIKKEDLSELEEDCKVLESIYAKWISKGYKAEHAAYFLCQGTAATVVITAFASDWKHFFDLRLLEQTGKVHPDMLAICKKARKVLEEHNLWGLIYKLN